MPAFFNFVRWAARSWLIAVLLAFPGYLGAASARDLTESEKGALAETIESFDAAMRANDTERVIGTIPPKILAAIAEEGGIQLEQLRPALAAQIKQAMASVTLVSFGMDLAEAEFLELGEGTPYALIPTRTVLDAGQGEVKVDSRTLALLDGGDWYLLRIDDAQQVEILRRVYPEFGGVEFEGGTLETVE